MICNRNGSDKAFSNFLAIAFSRTTSLFVAVAITEEKI
jgi:hypothetical protein